MIQIQAASKPILDWNQTLALWIRPAQTVYVHFQKQISRKDVAKIKNPSIDWPVAMRQNCSN
jgi:hypothetical protein